MCSSDLASGNVVVAGDFWGRADFGTGPLTAVTNQFGTTLDMFVAKYSSSGTPIWSRSMGGGATDTVAGVTVDGNGDVVLTGYFQNTADLGGGTLTSGPLGGFSSVVAKYASANGAFQWAKNFPATADNYGTGIAVDASNNILMAGSFSGKINYGGGDLQSAGFSDIGILKLSSAGSYIWSMRFGGVSGDSPTGVAVDHNGDVVVTGGFHETMPVGTTTLTSAGYEDIFLMKLRGTDGVPQWAERFGGAANDDEGKQLAVDTNNNIVLTGTFMVSASLGGSTFVGAGGTDIFVAKYSTAGGHLWSKQFGGTENDAGLGVAVDGGNNVRMVGKFRATASFGTTPLTSAGSDDGVIVGLTP